MSNGTAIFDPGNQSRLLHSYEEARAYMGGVPKRTFSQWISDGIIIPVSIGRRRFIRHEDLVRLASGEPREAK